MNIIFLFFRKLMMGLLLSFVIIIPQLSHSQTLVPPYNLEVLFTNDLVPAVDIYWEYTGDPFLYFLVERDGQSIGTTTDTWYYDYLPDFGTYCYDVYAVYDNGTSESAGPACIDYIPPEILLIPEYAENWMWPDETFTYYASILNLGGSVLFYTFPGFTGGSTPPGYITDVAPDSGIVSQNGGLLNIEVTWNSSGYGPGTYYQDLIVESNDPLKPFDTIENIMHIYTPAYVAGIVIDTASQIPVPDVEVTVGQWQTYTDNNGSYCLALDEGSYVMYFSKFGYPSVSVYIFPTAGDTLIVDVGMHSLINVSAPTNVEANIVDYPNGIVEFTWELDPGPGYNFVMLKKDGIPIGTTTSPPNPCILIDTLSDFGNYCYSVAAYYSFGLSEEVSACVEWVPPGAYVNPDTAVCYLQEDEISIARAEVFNNRSTSLTYTLPGFDIGSPPPGFIAQVNSASGVIPPGGTEAIFLTFDASAYSPGVYYQDVVLELSDTVKPTDTITCVMDVYFPGYVSGVVYYGIYSSYPYVYNPLAGLRVIAGTHSTRTFEDGSYALDLPEGDHEIYFEMPGYGGTHHNISIVTASTTSLGDTLYRIPEPVPWVTAQLDDCANPTFCTVEWGVPVQTFEYIYDDGSAEDIFAWASPYNENAVRISPEGYPAQLTGGSVFVGDGSFPNAYWIGSKFSVLVYDEDNTGFPGTLLDSIITTADQYYWVDFSGLNAEIDSGDFFLSMMQINPMPDCAPLGIDESLPLENRSYSRPIGGDWSLSVQQDFMIRAEIKYPSDSSILYYTFSRMSDFEPEVGPANGSMSVLNNVTTNCETDISFFGLPIGWWAYSIQTSYWSGKVSKYGYSNIVGQGMSRTVAFEVKDCLGNPVENAEVTMHGLDWPNEIFINTTNSSGNCTLECVWLGEYDVNVDGIGYQKLTFNTTIANDTLIEVMLNPTMYPPRNLWVDSVYGIAYWEEALITAVYEKFEDPVFPPDGWQSLSQGAGWSQSLDGGSAGFFIPSTGSRYAFVNDELAGAGNNACCDMLITPELDLREADNYMLSFDSYFTGALGQMATIEYSLDNGGTWDLLHNLIPAAGVWEHLEIDLSSFSGAGAQKSIRFAFHGDDGGGDATGWAIDNVDINAGPTDIDLYAAFLDGALCVFTDTTYYKYEYLTYGVTYTACAAANYSCGYSEYACADFTSGYLKAPTWLQGDSVGEDIELSWKMDTFYISQNILGYHVYRDSINIAFVPYIGEDTSYYTDVAPPPMCYDYHVSTLYDLSAYGFPGDTGESLYTGPTEVCLVYGTTLPIVEDWASGSFGSFWTAEDNWVINGQYGNPLPCAEFKWDPVLMDYQQCLTSGPINGMDHGTKSEPYIDGQFILNFDVSLVDNGASGTEYFNVEVWSDGVWNRVEQLSNANGNFEWENLEVDITEYALGYVFKVRFMAEGENSSKIISWFLDNIEVYHYCAPPLDLYAEYYPYLDIYLYWSPPLISVVAHEWIMWDDGVHFGGVGLTGGGVFSVASHWDADQITAYEGMYITNIRFVPYINAVTTSFTLKVWKGPDAGTLVYEEALSGLVLGDWNDITLATPVAIDVTKELWFGYTVDSPADSWPAGHDEGPAVAGYGDMISLDGVAWDPLSQISPIDRNWNLQAMIVCGDESNGELLLENDSQRAMSDLRTGSKGIIGYNIYLDLLKDEYEFVDFTEDTFYTYECQGNGLYRFVVTTVYEDCESGYSNVASVLIHSIDENDKNNIIRIFPNPASDMIRLESSVRMSRLCLHDCSGRMLQCHELQNQIQTNLDVSSYEPGIYLLRVDTEEGRFVRKLVVVR